MFSYAHHMAGRRYKIGYDSEVCDSPRTIQITALNSKTEVMDGDLYPISHYLKRKFERGATSKEVLETVKNPILCLNQWGGQRCVFVTTEMTVVLSSLGVLVTVWTKDEYDDVMKNMLADAGY